MFITKKRAFTLAEILVTLVIIGIVAALTIPSLLTSTQNNVTLTRLKKVHSILAQASQEIIIDGTDMATVWGASAISTRDYFSTKLNYIKKGVGSWPDVTVKWLNNNNWLNLSGNAATAMLNDGTLLYFMTFNNNCTTVYGPYTNVCGAIIFDINGFKSPNIWGKDVFEFWITSTTVVPTGYNGWDTCSLADTGQTCTYKFILQGEINYN